MLHFFDLSHGQNRLFPNPPPAATPGKGGRRFARGRHHGQHAPPLPACTDFSEFRGKRVNVVIDEDNWRISMRQNHRRVVSYRQVLERLQREAAQVVPVVVLTAEPGNIRRETYLRHRGWEVLTIPREIVPTWRGPVTKSNADMDLAYEAGRIAAQYPCDAFLVGSGDGDLCVAIMRGIKRYAPAVRVYTLAVTGSASRRLRECNGYFAGHLSIGKDLTRAGDGTAPSAEPKTRKGFDAHVRL